MIFGNFMQDQFCSHTACSLLVILQGALQKQSFFYAVFNSQNNIGSMRRYPELCQLFCSQGGLPQCMLGYHPPGAEPPAPGIPPGPGTPLPPGRGTPHGTRPPSRRPLLQTVRILLECILVKANCYS